TRIRDTARERVYRAVVWRHLETHPARPGFVIECLELLRRVSIRTRRERWVRPESHVCELWQREFQSSPAAMEECDRLLSMIAAEELLCRFGRISAGHCYVGLAGEVHEGNDAHNFWRVCLASVVASSP